MNFIMTFIGWIGWNWFEFMNAKDVYDEQSKPFGLKEYAAKKWDNWIWTLIVASALYIIGIKGLGMDLVQTFGETWKWSDLYYFGSGFFSEAISFAYRKWIKKSTLAEK